MNTNKTNKKCFKNLKFVIHKHKAYKAGLHYDLRLQIPGKKKLWSFAIRHQPGSQQNTLLIKQPDHTWKWLTFEGEIPKGEYGGGSLQIWDKGTYILCKDHPGTDLLEFHGTKLKGIYALVKLPQKNSYLLVKTKHIDSLTK